MSKKNDKHVCAVCGKAFASGELIPGAAVREVIANEIAREHSGWTPGSYICKPDLAQYRAKYVHSLLESEKGEITSLEEEVLQSIRDHELLAKNVDAEFEREWTLGERLADRIATFGGSWTFLMIFGAFITVWIAMNSLVLIWRPPDPYPFILLNLVLSVPGRHPGAGHHDEPEPAGGEGPPAFAA